MDQPQTMPSHLATTVSVCITSPLFIPIKAYIDTHSTRLKVIKQLNKASQSKTSNTAAKKKCWLLAQLFPYQSAKSTCFFPLQMPKPWPLQQLKPDQFKFITLILIV